MWTVNYHIWGSNLQLKLMHSCLISLDIHVYGVVVSKGMLIYTCIILNDYRTYVKATRELSL